MDERRSGARFGSSLMVAFGWHLAVVGGLLAFVYVAADSGVCFGEGEQCPVPSSAVTLFVTAFAVPVAPALLVGTPLIVRSLVRDMPSSAQAGWWSALASQIIAVALVIAWVALGG